MKILKITIAIFFFSLSTLSAQTVSDFTLQDVNNNKEVSLSDFSSKEAVVIIFTSNVCPYAIYYEGRITQLIANFKKKNVQFLLINSHTSEKESIEEMTNKIKTWGLDIPYLSDKNQKAKNIFTAKKSPEVFIVEPYKSSFRIFYNGAIDNNPQVATDVKDSYLRDNLNNLLSNKQAVRGGRPIGCVIK